MEAAMITPFLDAVVTVMPQLGFQQVVRGKMGVSDGNRIASLGVMVIVGLTRQYKGTVVYNMTEESAKRLASQMMMGMPVDVFDAMAESAISELANMLAANAAIIFEKQGTVMDISPPSIIVGESFTTTAGKLKRIIVEVLVDQIPIEVHVSVSA